MDEVKTMARAGENVGKVVGTGMRGARHGARRAGDVGVAMSKQAATRAEQELAQRGVPTAELQEQLAQRATGMSRKQLAKLSRKKRKQWSKRSAQQRKQLAHNTRAARKELAACIDPAARNRRKWPWFALAAMALASIAGAALMLTKRPEEIPLGSAGDDYPEAGIGSHAKSGVGNRDGAGDRDGAGNPTGPGAARSPKPTTESPDKN